MSYLAAFGSGMLEQGLENKRLAAERQYDSLKTLMPLVLEKRNEALKKNEAEVENRETLSKFYTQNEINLLASTNKNILYSDKAYEDAQSIITAFGGNDKFQLTAKDFTEEVNTGNQEDVDRYTKMYTEDIATKLGIGEETVNITTGRKSNTLEDQQAAATGTPVETTEVTSAETTDEPMLRQLAFQKEYNQPFDKVPGMAYYYKAYKDETGSDPLKDSVGFDIWMVSDAPVDENGKKRTVIGDDGKERSITNREKVDNFYLNFNSPSFDSEFAIAKNAKEVAKEQEEVGVVQTTALQYQMAIQMAISQGNQQLADALTQQAEDEGIDLNI
jgi:hypothetical protein